ncbi:hypothetical protein [Streptomyces sp. NPDC050856]|uniref:hypothetical protein n=1 Tax=Streptomyces sp. NPDC050856 TaxID=3154939 RepID=UPI0033CD9615
MTAATADDATPAGRRRGARLLDSSVSGVSPWIVFSLVAGPGRYVPAAVLALALALALVTARRLARSGASFLEPAAVVLFTVAAVAGPTVPAGGYRWLETHAAEGAGLLLVLFAGASIAVRRPFTLPYARRGTDPGYWHAPEFLRTNRVITGFWALAFLTAAVAGAIGDLVLRNPVNLWTAWLVQVVAFVTAARFTEWYPRLVRARLGSGEPEPPVRGLLAPFVGLLIPIGVLTLVLDAAASWFGVGLMVSGVILARALIRAEAAPTERGRRRLR